MPRIWRVAACLLGLTGVAVGAAAAHALADPNAASTVARASLYQLLHAIVLLVIAEKTGRIAALARLAFALGIVLFCGGIYLKFLAGKTWLGVLTPYGGTALMLGWLLAACSAYRRSPQG